MSGVRYPPCWRMEGMTSDVIQRLKAFADGSLLDSTRLYSPDSLMMVTFCIPPGVINSVTPLSSSSTWFATALMGDFPSPYPSASATSFPTNHGSPSISSVRSFPNSGLVKIVISVMALHILSVDMWITGEAIHISAYGFTS